MGRPRRALGSTRTDRISSLNWTGQEARLLLPDGVLQVPLSKEPKKHGPEVTPVQGAQAGVEAKLRVDILADHHHGVPACLAGPSKGHVAQEEGWQVVRCGFSRALFYWTPEMPLSPGPSLWTGEGRLTPSEDQQGRQDQIGGSLSTHCSPGDGS